MVAVKDAWRYADDIGERIPKHTVGTIARTEIATIGTRPARMAISHSIPSTSPSDLARRVIRLSGTSKAVSGCNS